MCVLLLTWHLSDHLPVTGMACPPRAVSFTLEGFSFVCLCYVPATESNLSLSVLLILIVACSLLSEFTVSVVT